MAGIKAIFQISIFTVFSSFSFSDSWVIGLDADLSGDTKIAGQAIQQGIELALEEINEAGGLLGKTVTLDVRDHRGNPARGIANLQAMATNDQLLGVFSGIHTPVAIAQLPIIHEKKIVFLDPWAAGTSIVDNGYSPNYVFRLSVRDEWAAKVIFAAAKKENCQSIHLFLERTGWGRSNEISMELESTTQKLPITGKEWFNWNSTTLAEIVTNAVDRGTNCIAMVANPPEGAEIVRTVANLPEKLRPKIFSHWGILGADFPELVGQDKLDKVNFYFLQTLAATKPKTDVGKLLVERYENTYGDPSTLHAFNGVAHAYDLMHLFALAVTRANSSDRKLIRSALEEINRFDGVMKTYESPFSSNNHEALSTSDYLMLQFSDFKIGKP